MKSDVTRKSECKASATKLYFTDKLAFFSLKNIRLKRTAESTGV